MLPGLDDLVWLADFRRDDADWIFEGDVRDWGVEQQAHKVERGLLFATGAFCWKPPRTAHRQMRAGRVGNQEVP